MKKIKWIMPFVAATTIVMPFMGMVSCNKGGGGGGGGGEEPDDPINVDKCFVATALENSTFRISSTDNPQGHQWYHPDMKYSLNNGKTWNEYKYNDDQPTVVPITKGNKMIFYGNNPEGFKDYGNDIRPRFLFTGSVELSGNIMSLIDNGLCEANEIPCEKCFSKLFYYQSSDTDYNTSIKTAKNLLLPAKKITKSCYEKMFSGNSRLEFPPSVLPATSLSPICYEGMFFLCKNLKQAPFLPANKLSGNCYDLMFSFASSLKIVETDSSTNEQGLIFTFSDEGGTGNVDSMFSHVSGDSPFKGENPTPGHSYYWITD